MKGLGIKYRLIQSSQPRLSPQTRNHQNDATSPAKKRRVIAEVIIFPGIFSLLTYGLSAAYFFVFIAHSFSISYGLAHSSLDQVVMLALGGSIVGEWIFLGVLILWLRRQKFSIRDLGWRRPTSRSAIVLGIVVALVYSAFTLLNPTIFSYAGQLGPLKALAVGSAITSGLIEEISFRGFIMTKLQSAGASTPIQILYSAFAYGLVHVYAFSLVGFIFTFVLGSVFAWLYNKGKRSLTPTIISHTIVDLIIEPALTFFALSFLV